MHNRKLESMCCFDGTVLENDGTWRICGYYHAINNITIKYSHSISRLHYMLDELHGSCIFTKVYLKN